MVLLFVILLSECSHSVAIDGNLNHLNDMPTFVLDKTWPDPKTVQSLHVHGSAVAIDKNKNLILLHRGSTKTQSHNNNTNSLLIQEDVIFIISSTNGKILASWGADKFAKPHGIGMDGQNIFITDVVLHQVFKFTYDAGSGLWKRNATLELGEKFVSGSDASHFCSPADVAVSSATGDFYVADGYCNSRIVKFSQEGVYLSEFGASASNSILSKSVLEFNVTHSVSVVEIPEFTNSSAVRIFVADRNNGRIQCFLENGTFLYEIPYEVFGKTKAMLLSVVFHPSKVYRPLDEPLGTLYAVTGHLPVGQSAVFEMLVGYSGYHLRSSFLFTPGVNTHNNWDTINRDERNQTQIFETPHDMALSENGRIMYVVESNSKLIVRKFVRFYPKTSSGICLNSGCFNIELFNVAIAYCIVFVIT